MHRVPSCPVCGNTSFSHKLTTKDFTTTGEEFSIEACQTCGFLLTNPQPDENILPKYYQSTSYVSHKEKPTDVFEKIYHLARKFALEWKLKQIKKYAVHYKSIMDFGCGAGDFLKVCAANQINVSGVEPSPAARNITEQKINTRIAPSLASYSGTTDVITAWHVIEHVPNLSETIQLLHSHLNKNGTMFIAVPNHESHDAKKHGPLWAAYDVPRHLWHFSKTTMTKLVTDRGFELIAIRPMKLDAFYVSLLSEKYRQGKMSFAGILAALTTGLISNIHARQSNNYSSLVYVFRKK